MEIRRSDRWIVAAWIMLLAVAALIAVAYFFGLFSVFGAEDVSGWFKFLFGSGLALAVGGGGIVLAIAIRDRMADSESSNYDDAEA